LNVIKHRVVAGILGLLVLLAPARSGQERIQKDVTVTLVEVPVRILRKGRPVRDLGRDQFRVFENGVEKEISRFEVISRQIADPPAPGPASRVPRLFLLLFNVYDNGPAVGAAIDEFFHQVFRADDSVIVVTEDRVLNFERGRGIENMIVGLKDALTRFKGISTLNTLKNFRELDDEGDRLLGALQGGGGSPAVSSIDQSIVRFFENYRFTWETYRNQFLLPDLSFFRLLLSRIKSFEGEKWALCFQQREMFPMLKNSSRLDLAIGDWMGAQVDPQDQVKARLVQARQEDLRRSLDLKAAFSPDLLGDLFLGADMTFHLILLGSSRMVFSQNFELREVGQDFEAMLKRVSAFTGGYTDFSSRPVDVLREAVQKEDYHYLLVYSGQELPAGKDRTTEVKVDLDGVEIVFLRHPFRRDSDHIAISDVEAAGGGLSFSISHCRMLTIDGRRRGTARVKLVLYDQAREEVFDEERTLDLTGETTRISLSFEKLGPGDYFLIIDAVDLVTGERDVYNGSIELISARSGSSPRVP
jgi:hypothetical protein